MLEEHELKLIQKLNFIPDSMLARYLEGKLLVKPDYPSELKGGTIQNRYQEYRTNVKKAQLEANRVANPKRRY